LDSAVPVLRAVRERERESASVLRLTVSTPAELRRSGRESASATDRGDLAES